MTALRPVAALIVTTVLIIASPMVAVAGSDAKSRHPAEAGSWSPYDIFSQGNGVAVLSAAEAFTDQPLKDLAVSPSVRNSGAAPAEGFVMSLDSEAPLMVMDNARGDISVTWYLALTSGGAHGSTMLNPAPSNYSSITIVMDANDSEIGHNLDLVVDSDPLGVSGSVTVDEWDYGSTARWTHAAYDRASVALGLDNGDCATPLAIEAAIDAASAQQASSGDSVGNAIASAVAGSFDDFSDDICDFAVGNGW